MSKIIPWALIVFSAGVAQGAKPAQSIAELQQQLKKILADTHTPGVSVAIVRRDGPEWVGALGESDVAANRAASADTRFRIGSVSKGFVSLSILKLVNEGKLSLDDPVRKIVPEIRFQNRWEATDPVRVVDLLEHTTGWDDIRPRDYAKDARNMTLREGLDFNPSSRTSRWRPGTRMAYCNSGPAVAAYIVEKLTGQRFEDYVTRNFFLPIGMKTATYFEEQPLTKLYHADAKTPYPYWNILLRPAGSINASARDMAAYVQFYLNRGTVNGTEVMPAASIDRMETPTRTWAARQGLKAGYGLSNYTSIYDGFVYHGHNGGVNGGLTELAYLPDYGVGYLFSINSGSGEAFEKIGKAIRAYLTRSLSKPPVPAAGPLPDDAEQFTGWYEPVSPRTEMTHFLDRLFALHRLDLANGNLLFINITGTVTQTFVPVRGEQFRYLPEKEAPQPIATLALLPPNAEGRFIEAGATWKHIHFWQAWLEIIAVGWFLLAVPAILIYAPFWILGGWKAERRRPSERAIRLWPFVAALSLAVFLLLFAQASDDLIERLGNPTFWSVGMFLATLVFAAGSLASVAALWLARKRPIRRSVWWFSAAVTGALLVATLYFGWCGVIGLRTWG